MSWHNFQPGSEYPITEVIKVLQARLDSGKIKEVPEKLGYIELFEKHSKLNAKFKPFGGGWGASPFNPKATQLFFCKSDSRFLLKVIFLGLVLFVEGEIGFACFPRFRDFYKDSSNEPQERFFAGKKADNSGSFLNLPVDVFAGI